MDGLLQLADVSEGSTPDAPLSDLDIEVIHLTKANWHSCQ